MPAMAQRVANVFRKMTADMMNVPEAGVWVVRANAWGTTLRSLAPWGVPLGLIGVVLALVFRLVERRVLSWYLGLRAAQRKG